MLKKFVKISLLITVICISIYNTVKNRKLQKEIEAIKLQNKYIYKQQSGGIENLKPAFGKLRDFQLKSLEELKIFKKFAIKNDIKYWIDFGTLLGAVRHKGFIPWDDDIDVSMDEENVEKLISAIEKSKDFGYQYYDGVNGKLIFFYRKGLKSGEKRIKIDVFRYSCIDEKSYKKHYRYAKLLNTFFPTKLVSKMIRNKLDILKKPMKNCKNDDFLLMRAYKTSGKEPINNLKFRYNDIYPLKYMKFEGVDFPVPNNADSVLSQLYSKNYMDLPNDFGVNHDFSNVSMLDG